MTILKRGSIYQLRRRVPRRYAAIEPRSTVWISLHTDSQQIAENKAKRAWAQMIEGWEARLAGESSDAEARFAAAQELAAVRGFRYLDIDRVKRLPVNELVERVEAIDAPGGAPNQAEATALLGTAQEPAVTTEKALELYWRLAKDKTFGKSEDQLRRWRNPRIKAVRNFINVVGDKPIDQITRDDMLDFRQHWLERIETGGLTANSANKDLIHLGDILKTINRMKRLGLDLPLGELSFKEGEKRSRPPFSDAWIKEKILAPKALDGLNPEAKGLILGMVNTGYRPSEGAGLTEETICLRNDVPHIRIEPDGRQLKSQYARREIPLTGVSLEALQSFPDGFPRYRDSASLSATVNKYLKANDLLETPNHSFYSLRHSFEDRMLEAGIDELIRRDLFGHTLDRERYGKGASLARKAELLAGLAF